MRQYRGLNKSTKEWVYGWYCQVESNHFIIPEDAQCCRTAPDCDFLDGLAGQIEVIPETVGQFTGLRDKSGTEGIQRDLISHCDRNGGKPIEIIWIDGSWRGKYVGTDFSFVLNQLEMGRSKILGNRFQNPDLLENKQ